MLQKQQNKIFFDFMVILILPFSVFFP
jgi:hypothetical protein